MPNTEQYDFQTSHSDNLQIIMDSTHFLIFYTYKLLKKNYTDHSVKNLPRKAYKKEPSPPPSVACKSLVT